MNWGSGTTSTEKIAFIGNTPGRSTQEPSDLKCHGAIKSNEV